MRRYVRVGPVLVAVLALSVSGFQRADTFSQDIPASCDISRPAVAFHPGATGLIQPQPSGGPIPCGSSTGFAAVESRIAVSAAGVVYTPAKSLNGTVTGVAISTDQGGTWTVSGSNGGTDNALYTDQATGRIFWVKFNQGSAPAPNREVAFSDDGGSTWTIASACCLDAENSRLITAAPTPGGPQPVGYPNVVYLCSNTSLLGGVGFPGGGRVCSRSLDGGITYTIVSLLFSKPVPKYKECLPYGEYFGASEGAYPEAGPNGSLYVMVHCGLGHIVASYLARSDDEGVTWPILREIPFGQELRVDSEGNLYMARTSPVNDAPLLQISRDEGRTWTHSVEITPAGVEAHSHHPENNAFQTSVRAAYWPDEFTSYQWYMQVFAPGVIAFNFYGHQAPRSEWDGWISMSRDALASEPVWWGAPINPPSLSLTNGAFAGEYSFGNEHVGLGFGPDGSPWGSFTNGVTGYAGRLLWTG